MFSREYRYRSVNMLESFSLHDCSILLSTLKNNTLVFRMDYVDVLPSNPLNPSKKAKCTGKASIIFNNAIVYKSMVYEKIENMNEHLPKQEQVKPSPLNIIESPYRFLVLDCYREEGEKKYIYSFSGDLWTPGKRRGAGLDKLTIQFTEVIVCWNELIKDSWFESAPG